ncbi:MAG: SOS response-associated peptidase [Candidatus Izemoplasmatales bacterium]
MCGRFILGVVREELERLVDEYYGIPVVGTEIALPRYNVAPGQPVAAVVGDGERYRLGTLRWGFVPWFAKDEKSAYAMINARAETILERPAYAQSMKTKRCVVLADGYYEWKKEGTSKIPYRIFLKDVALFAMAGLYSTWTRADGTKLHTCAIVTTAANELTRPVHERMPAILTREQEKIWLDRGNERVEELAKLLIPFDPGAMDLHPVSTRVNDAHSDDAGLIEQA